MGATPTKAAFVSAVLLFMVGDFALFVFAMTLGEMLLEGVRLPWMSLLLPMFTIGVLGCLAAWMNLRWARRLKLAAPSAGHPVRPTRFSVRELLAAIAVIACVTALVAYFIRSTPPRYAENVSRDDAPFGLPVDARDVSFCQGFRETIAYEFTIDENGFIAWVDSGIGSLESDAANISLKPITTPYVIRRYYALASDLTGPDSITVINGLYYAWSKEDRGVYAAFDRTTNRAYYYFH